MEESKGIGALIFRLRYVSILAVISSFIASFMVFAVGLKKVLVSIWQYLAGVQIKSPGLYLAVSGRSSD
jgi:uncharacterized membrane protein YqhA